MKNILKSIIRAVGLLLEILRNHKRAAVELVGIALIILLVCDNVAMSRQIDALATSHGVLDDQSKSDQEPQVIVDTGDGNTVGARTMADQSTVDTLTMEERVLLDYKKESIKKLGSGKMPLEGIDISSFQAYDNWRDYIDNTECVICRYSYGCDKDAAFDEYMKYAKSAHKLIGLYFFTNDYMWRNTSPEEYADWCIKETSNYLGQAVFVLDCEIEYGLTDQLDSDWILRWLEYFYKNTGVKPILYTYQGLLKASEQQIALSTIHEQGFGLWLANYGTDAVETVERFSLLPFWRQEEVFGHQYTALKDGVSLDRDVFYCSPEAWYLYAEPVRSF